MCRAPGAMPHSRVPGARSRTPHCRKVCSMLHATLRTVMLSREPLSRTLIRNVAIAAAVGAGLAIHDRELSLWLPCSVLALWFSLGGHYVEALFLNQIRPRVRTVRRMLMPSRLLVWFAGGALLYIGMAITARALPLAAPGFRLWWFGGLLLVGIELVVHAVLALRGRPNFYMGSG